MEMSLHHWLVYKSHLPTCIYDIDASGVFLKGAGITVGPETILKFRDGDKDKKREACNELLDLIKNGIKLVTTTAPDYETLKIFWTLRQIYTPVGTKLTSAEKVKITRR